jgi:hypothetical protein
MLLNFYCNFLSVLNDEPLRNKILKVYMQI